MSKNLFSKKAVRFLQNDRNSKSSVVLNFTEQEKDAIKAALKEFPERATTAYFEERRWFVNGCTVTLYKSGKLVVQGNNCESVAKMLLGRVIKKEDFVLGIDEAGRGERTGVFTIAAVLADNNRMRELRDSKKIDLKKLEEKAKIVQENSLASAIVVFSPEFVDIARKSGLTMNELQKRFISLVPKLFETNAIDFKIKVDGGPIDGVEEAEFIIHGDDLCATIGAASILAKLAREKSPNKAARKTWKPKSGDTSPED